MAARVIHTCLSLVHFVFVFASKGQTWARLKSFGCLTQYWGGIADSAHAHTKCSCTLQILLSRAVSQNTARGATIIKRTILPSPRNTFYTFSSWRIATMLSTYPALKHPPQHGTLLSCSAFFFFFIEIEKKRTREACQLCLTLTPCTLLRTPLSTKAHLHAWDRWLSCQLRLKVPTPLLAEPQKVQMRHIRLQDTACSNACMKMSHNRSSDNLPAAVWNRAANLLLQSEEDQWDCSAL